MPTQDMNAADTAGAGVDLDAARADLVAALDGAEPHRDNIAADGPDGLAKVGDEGLALELRLNGATIPLDGKDVNDLAPGDFKAFIDRQKLAIEDGSLDDAIARALATPGPGKALARVRAIGVADDIR